MLKYQNADGGMGSGFEADVLCPLSAAIPTAEAIFQAYEYRLDCGSDWFGSILAYFENSVQDIPKYWEDSPKEAIGSPLVTDEVMTAMQRRILENTCFDVSKYNGYYFTPLDFVSSPDSMWYDDLKQGIEPTFDFWLDSINEQGVWTPNFSWGIDSDVSRQVTKNWTGYVTVKRAKILFNFDRIEK